jgi:hypothetical protein
MYDDIIQAYCSRTITLVDTFSPLQAVEIPRKLVMSTLSAFIRRRYLNIVNVHKDQMIVQALWHNCLSSFSKRNMYSGNSVFFNLMVGSCAASKVFRHEMADNAIALGLDATQHLAPSWVVDG